MQRVLRCAMEQQDPGAVVDALEQRQIIRAKDSLISTMKRNDKRAELLLRSGRTLDQLRDEVRKRISREELEHSWRLEAMDRVITLLQLDPATFQDLWIRPLLEAGATMDTAIACIAESHFQPN